MDDTKTKQKKGQKKVVTEYLNLTVMGYHYERRSLIKALRDAADLLHDMRELDADYIDSKVSREFRVLARKIQDLLYDI